MARRKTRVRPWLRWPSRPPIWGNRLNFSDDKRLFRELRAELGAD